jgi:4-amino-4-deoxy-L-arabinose transferase-like glycosyltransferase
MADTITCPMCGFENQGGATRCVSCGAKIEAFGAGEYTEEESLARRFEQEDFEWKWAGIACGVYVALQTVFLVIFPLLISSFDPQGLAGLGISVVIWFFGGIVMGIISPGKTFLEPAVGAAIAALPTILYQRAITPEGFEPSLLAYIVSGVLGIMISLFGAFIGERIQMSGGKHA